MYLVAVHPLLRPRGRPFPRSSRSRSRVNLRVLQSLTRGPQGQPSPLQTPHGCPGVQGIFGASRGKVRHGWPTVPDTMATGFPFPRGCCLALSVAEFSLLRFVGNPAMSFPPPHLTRDRFVLPARVPLSNPLVFLSPVSRYQGDVVRSLPQPLPGPVPAPYPANRAYKPPGRREAPWRSVSRFHCAVAWWLSPPCPCCSARRVFPDSRPLSCSGPCARARVLFVSCSCPSSRVHSPPGRPLPLGSGPRDLLSSRDRSRGRSLLLTLLSSERCPRFLPSPVAPLFSCASPSSHVHTPPGRRQLPGAGPSDNYLPLALVAPIHTPTFFFFSLCVDCILVFSLGPSSVHTPWAASLPTSLCVSVPCPVVSCVFLPSSLHVCTTLLHWSSAVAAPLSSSHRSSRPRGAVPLALPGQARGPPLPRITLPLLPAPPKPPSRVSHLSPLLLLCSPVCAGRSSPRQGSISRALTCLPTWPRSSVL